MSCATKSISNSLSMATNGCCIVSLSSLFSTKKSTKTSSFHPFLAIPSKPIKLNLSCSFSYCLLSLKKNNKFSSLVSALTAQEGEENTLVLEEENFELEGYSGGEDVIEAVEDAGESEGGEEVEEYQEPPEDAKLFVGNLPYDVDSEKLAHLFEQAGVVEIAEVIYNRETDRSRGFGFVTMSTVEEAEMAVEMFHRYDLNGRFLTVNKAAPRGSQPERTPQVYEPSSRIYVGNLPWDVDNARLEQIFSEHGKVVNARVVYDRDSGRSRGFGFVAMSSESEMNDAIASLDGQSLDGRAIRVNVAEERPRRF
ncbi:hypothetical protein ACH5RR_025380 [Cinchona calisaya]|uniref:RRM domain-containing protein n=1 Tax=Cinchona calisaya TaxID=153742 RepID=A0ABD2Z0K5_9GENT